MKRKPFSNSFQKSRLFLFKDNKVSKSQFRNLSKNNISRRTGSLTSVLDISNAEFYSDNIRIQDAYKLVNDTDHIYKICLNNAGRNTAKLAENLKKWKDAAEMFTRSSEIWDRDELVERVENIVESVGKFFMYTRR